MTTPIIDPLPRPCTAFAGANVLARGPLAAVAIAVRDHLDDHPDSNVLVFEDGTGQVVDLDLRGSSADIAARLSASEPRGRGRPKLGVVAREVTLLPRHWEWLAGQPGGASPALRRLIEDARRQDRGGTQARSSQEAAYRFLTALAGDLPGYEEALRALFAGEEGRFATMIAGWPEDIRTYAQELAWGSLREGD